MGRSILWSRPSIGRYFLTIEDIMKTLIAALAAGLFATASIAQTAAPAAPAAEKKAKKAEKKEEAKK
jgi:ribosomal protein L12E/L44/L45/RPP1/RPP2